MRLTTFFIAILLGFFSASLFGQNQGRILWEADKQLSWTDFKAKANPGSHFHASTSSGVKYAYGYSSDGTNVELNFEVQAYFEPARSWSKKDKQTEYLLAHEQLHFDITELSARKLRKAFSQLEFSKKLEAEVKRIYQQNIEDRKEMQQRYDKETDHSNIKEMQEKWARFVREELEKMKDFALAGP